MFNKNWKDIRYKNNHKAIAVRHMGFYCCVRCKPGKGLCKYAICKECQGKANQYGGTTSPFVSPYTVRHIECKHQIENLELELDPWWCKKEYIFSMRWFMHAHGCANCGGLFYNFGDGYKNTDIDDAKKDKFLKKSTHNMDEEKYLQWVEESESKQEEDVPPRNDDALGLEMES